MLGKVSGGQNGGKMQGGTSAFSTTAANLQGGGKPAVSLGACGLDSSSAGKFPESIALGPSNPFSRGLPMSGCGACFEVQCGNGTTSPQASKRCGAQVTFVSVIKASSPHRSRALLATGQYAPRCTSPLCFPVAAASHSSMLCRFLAQAAGCFAAPGGGVASTVTLTLQDSCAGCAGVIGAQHSDLHPKTGSLC
jgi:hypothetical protein